jgi:putative flippase GtrA
MIAADSDQSGWEPGPAPERNVVTRTPTPDTPAPPAEVEDARARDVESRAGRWDELLAWLQQDGVLAQLCRFALVGGASSLVYALLFAALERVGSQPANVVALVLSSILANDLHRRLTFHAGQRLSWLSAQVQGGGVSLVSLAATTVALGWLARVDADAGLFLELALVGAVFAVIGGLRFLALRWLFLIRRPTRS